jgi:ABC-type nitrate/sulfonate/bicarbonate transport system substrate-binding protein
MASARASYRRELVMKTTTKTGWLFSTLLSSLLALDQGWAADEKVSVALPAVPPVFGGVVALVAKEEGFFKKYGLDVDVHPRRWWSG